MFVHHRFVLNQNTIKSLKNLPDPFEGNEFGRIVFYRTYSRIKEAGCSQENWLDVVVRVMNGIMSIRKDWYIKNHIEWNESYWQEYADGMAKYFYEMKFSPPGRGLWSCGTQFVYERGSMALFNCAATYLTSNNLANDIHWLMDALMLGCGVGFNPLRDDNLKLYQPKNWKTFVIQDKRESWCDSVAELINSYLLPNQKEPKFDYSMIRPSGTPIKGFGGICTGYEALEILHDQIRHFCIRYIKNSKEYDSVRLKTDIANCVGCCVVSGNCRRSAEIAIGEATDPIFKDLKNYNKFPDRINYGWMSNNSLILSEDKDFDYLSEISQRVIINSEPGLINLQNFPKGRIGKRDKIKKDLAKLINPCSEIPLEDKELCNLAETFPTRCNTIEEWYKACEYATLYCTTVSLLPTHRPETNKVIARNRRIGISIVDCMGWMHQNSTHQIISWLRKGYKNIRKHAKIFSDAAGVPEPIRVTCLKPGGTIPKIADRRSGMGYSGFRYMIRRIRIQQYSPIYYILHEANIPHEPDFYSQNTEVFEYPLDYNDGTKTAEEVTIWQQALNLILFQREWADNACSTTLMFRSRWILKRHIFGKEECEHYLENIAETFPEIDYKNINVFEDKHIKIEFIRNEKNEISEIKQYLFNPKHEEDDLESVISVIAPVIKTCCLSPHTPIGVYPQMPESGCSKEEYERRLKQIKKINWGNYNNITEVEIDKYCSGPKCELPIKS